MSGHVTVDSGTITSNVEFDSGDVLRIYGTVAVSNPVVVGTTAVITTPLTIGSITSGTIASVTNVAGVDHLATGTLASVTNVAQVAHLVTGTLASVTNVAQVAHLVTGTLASVTNVAAVAHIVTGTLASVTSVATVQSLSSGTVSADINNTYMPFLIADGLTGTVSSRTTAEVDRHIRALNIIDNGHHEIHEGHNFRGTSYDADTDTNQSVFWVFKTNSYVPHVVYDICSTLNGRFKLWEGVSVGTLSGTITLYNARRDNSATTAANLWKDPSGVATAGAVMLENCMAGGGLGTGRIGANINRNSEWNFATGTNYAFEFISLADNNVCAFNISFYEEDKPHTV